MKQSQRKFVIERLREKGKISRNYALERRITRLGAIICSLKKEGWEINAYRQKNDGPGWNYIYEFVATPKRLKVVQYTRPDGGIGFKETWKRDYALTPTS